MSDTKISEAAVEAAFQAYIDHDDTVESSIRAALAAALPHLHPQPAELAEQQGDARSQCEAWAQSKGMNTSRWKDGKYMSRYVQEKWEVWQAALAATGKQQVGDGIAETFAGVKAKLHPVEWSILMAGLSDARAAQQVGEVQGDGITAEWVLGYFDTDLPERSREAVRDAFAEYRALAARQQVGNAEQLEHALGQTIDQRDRCHEVADEMAAHIERITGVEIGEHSSDNCPWQNAIEAAESYSPAQGIDPGPVREFLRRRMAQWRSHLPSDPGAPGTVAISGDGEGGYNNDVRMYREGIALMDRVLALIDDQRDAAQGIDLGQFRQAVVHWYADADNANTNPGWVRAEADRLLALIDQRDSAPGVE